jgi:hypothetical protein
VDDEKIASAYLNMSGKLREISKWQREVTFVNSWYCQEHESAAMWSLYLKTQEGIAIQSTYDRLSNAFVNYHDYDINIGRVSYIDYEHDTIPQGNILFPVMCKRKSFEHEREIRALIWTLQGGKNDWGAGNKLREVYGLNVGVAIETLTHLRVPVHCAAGPRAPRRIASGRPCELLEPKSGNHKSKIARLETEAAATRAIEKRRPDGLHRDALVNRWSRKADPSSARRRPLSG